MTAPASTDPLDPVFRALADPTRRAVLDALFADDGQTVGHLCDRFAMTRFGVMKHLAVLEEAGLVVAVRAGREKRLHLNPVPIEQIADRWISKYAARFTAALVGLERHLDPTKGGCMSITAHVYQIYLAAEPEQVWEAITDSAWTQRYFHGTRFVEPPRAGAGYRTVSADGGDAVEGRVEEMTPPGPGTLGRFVVTWRVLYDAALAQEPPSRVEWTVEAAGVGLTRVRLVHGDLAMSPLTWANVKDGWVWVLDGLKTLLETGRPLPRPSEPLATSATPVGDWHRRQGVEANNDALALLARPDRTDEDDETLLRTAYAAAFHWQQAAGAASVNEVRATYLVSRALTATGQAERGLVDADRCLARCVAAGHGDFDLAYAHEARARALTALGRLDEAGAAAAAARSVPIAGPEDRRLVESDLADL